MGERTYRYADHGMKFGTDKISRWSFPTHSPHCLAQHLVQYFGIWQGVFCICRVFFMKITSNSCIWVPDIRLCLIGFKAEFSGRGKKPQATYLWSHCHLKHCQYALSYYTNWHKTAKSYICIYVWKSPWSFPSSVSVIDGLGEVGEGGTLEEEKIYPQI